jgi:pimeloyl-ACP methyl ester carboxylesterase
MRTRVVFIPGIMGSVLADDQLQGWSGARSRCQDNLDYLVDTALSVWGKAFVQNANPCEEPNNPAVLWGEYGMLHWFFDAEGWVRRMTKGNGIERGHGVVLPPPVRNHGLAKIALNAQALGTLAQFLAGPFTDKLNDTVIDPYGPMIDMLDELHQQRQIDLLVFAHDWRLSIAYNATVLAEVIRKKWWRRATPEEFDALRPDPDDQVTIIAHSMGGLVARYYIEASQANLSYIQTGSVRNVALEGHRLVRRLIAIGTPHLGSLRSYLSCIGVVNPLALNNGIFTFLRSQLYLPKLFDLAADKEVELVSRGRLSLPSSAHVGSEEPRAGEKAVQDFDARAIAEHMSSLIEMFPVWDFTDAAAASQPEYRPTLIDSADDAKRMYTYYWQREVSFGREKNYKRPLKHSGSSFPPWRIFHEFRRRLVTPECLGLWLKSRNVRYHLLGSVEHPTITSFSPRTGGTDEQSGRGDSVVPRMSALLSAWSGQDYIDRWQLRSANKHDMLCRDVTAVDMCRDLVTPVVAGRRSRRTAEVVSIGRFEDIRGLADHIILTAGFRWLPRRIVISVTTIRLSSTADRQPFATLFKNGRVDLPVSEYLPKKNPWKTASWEITYESGQQSIGRRRIVGVDAQQKGLAQTLGIGGVVFLPELPCQDYLEVITWNLGERDTISKGTDNSTHAEVQFARWFVDRFGPWITDRARTAAKPILQAVDITNKGSGDSPCAQCQEELREIGSWVKEHAKLECVGTLSWSRLYDINKPYSASSGPTYLADLARTKGAGWRIDPLSPCPTK